MNNSVKVLVSILGIPGGTLRKTGERVVPWSLSKKDLNYHYKGKDRNNPIEKGITKVPTYEIVPCTHVLKLTQDAYNYMTGKNRPYWLDTKKYNWSKMSKVKRLECHIDRIRQSFNGTNFTYSVLED